MAYDLHGSWDRTLGHNSPLYSREGETSAVAQLNQDWGVTYWLSNGAPPEKIMLGIATYGRTFLTYNGNQMGDWALGPGRQGTFTEEAGFLAYYEICHTSRMAGPASGTLKHSGTLRLLPNRMGGYDDVDSITIKKYIKSTWSRGRYVWAIDMDDFRGTCGNVSNPLLRTIREYPSK
ncbi:chitotriosidase-1-like [Argopecten irradians]|uniref:chitotriosidase-1-like n=1 Tax=Argopecten irradians TaxID=31199 RepID=UPI003720FD2D